MTLIVLKSRKISLGGTPPRVRIDLQPQELMRIDGFGLVTRETSLHGKRGERLQHFTFNAFCQFERNIEKVSRAAGGIKNARGAKLVVKSLNDGPRARRYRRWSTRRARLEPGAVRQARRRAPTGNERSWSALARKRRQTNAR